MRNQEVIRISKSAYQILSALSEETKSPISDIASTLIVCKDMELRLSEKVIKSIETVKK